MLDILLQAEDQEAGSAFNTTDLLLLRGWCEFHGLSMGIDLAGRIDDLRCDEVVALTARDGSGSWAMWRAQDDVVLQGRQGVARRFASVCDAMAAIAPPAADTLSDIQPSVW